MIRTYPKKLQVVISRSGGKYTIWTAENVGINAGMRGSIVPAGQLKRTLPELIDWILAKHGRAHQRTAAARAARERNASKLIIHDKIVLHKAEKGRG